MRGQTDPTRSGTIQLIDWSDTLSGQVRAGVTTRHGGVSSGVYDSLNLSFNVGDDPAKVLANRKLVADYFKLDLDRFVVPRQVHGNDVFVVTESAVGLGASSSETTIEADALVTDMTGVALMVLVADCVPVILWDPQARVVAAVHAGWRGTVKKVLAQALIAMQTLGASPCRIEARIGPAIAPDRYQVGPEVLDQALDSLGESSRHLFSSDGTGKFLFDLWSANEQQLLNLGVEPSKLFIEERDSTSLFFSHRSAQPSGRFAAVVVIDSL